MSEPEAHLQRPCMVCNLMVDLPAVWSYPCGAWRLCYRSACQLRIPRDHRDGACGMPAARLRWLPAHAEELQRLSAKRRILWVATSRVGQPLARDGHFAELSSSVSVNDALTDYAAGPGVNATGDVVRWQMWDHGQMGASG
jgi:hypothetical protein